jgi:hypothetical protein
LGSVLVYTLTSNALWWARGFPSLATRYGVALLHAGRFSYYLGIPYLVLGGWPLPPYRGLLAPINLGLVALDALWTPSRWLEAAGTGVAVGLFAVGFVSAAWLNANRRGVTTRLCFSAAPAWALVIDSLYLEVHWAFYRGALAVLFDDLYLGVFWGLALIYLERLSNPFWRRCWRQERCAGDAWLFMVRALVSALLFLLTQNLWVCLAVHWALALTSWVLARTRR